MVRGKLVETTSKDFTPEGWWDLIQGVIPTVVVSLVGLGTAGNHERSLSNLPCLGSRAIIAGWYSVVDEALRASDHTKVLKLYEAAVCIPLRLRCGLSIVQVSLDSITYPEDLFASNSANPDAFITFAEKVMAAFPAWLCWK